MCEYCTVDSTSRRVLGYDGARDAIGIAFGDNLAVIESDSWEFDVEYCPKCGRKLVEG